MSCVFSQQKWASGKSWTAMGRQHHVTILLTFALFDTDDHALTVDIGRLQTDGLGDAETGGVASRQNRPMFGAAHAAQKVEDLLGLRTTGSLWGFFGAGMTSSKLQSFLRETL